MNENKLKVWLARDMNGSLYLSQIKPKKEKFDWVIENPEYANNYVKIDANNFPSVKWEDAEPTEAYITLAEPQEQPTPKQEIDWEQRRYEIAKDLGVQYSKTDERGATYSAYEAIKEELKKQKRMNYDITMCGNTNCKKRLDCLRYATHEAYRSDKGNKPLYVSMAYVPDTEKCDLFVKLNRRE